MTVPPQGLRIGELSRRLGVPPETLRAWERRYGVLRPARTEGGYRVYDEGDQRRARRMRELIREGWAAGEAAAAVAVDGEARVPGPDRAAPARLGPAAAAAPEPPAAATVTADALLDPLVRFDAAGAEAAFDRLLATRTLDGALRDVVLPTLRAIGDGWERGELTVAHEHFAANILGGRLRGLAREWGHGLGPRAVLACPAGEQHDLGLVCCGVALRARGWRVTYLGVDTPAPALASAVDAVAPAVVVLAILREEVLRAALERLDGLPERVRVAAGGAGTRADRLREAGVQHLAGDPVSGAAELTAALQASA